MSEAIRLLLVEDDGDSRTLVESVLRREGFRVSSAPSAERALQQLGEEAFDLVLTDVKLGKLGELGKLGTMDGVAFAKEVWKLRPELGIAMLSGYRGAGLSALNGEPRLLAYFEKPVYDLRGMANTLKSVLQRYRESSKQPPL